MSGAHTDVRPELRKLAQAILDGIDPAVRVAAAMASGGGPGTGKCQQVWCPLCALAALVTGEQHPLLTVIADHSLALLEVIRAIVDDIDRSAKPPPEGPPGGGQTGASGGENTNGEGSGSLLDGNRDGLVVGFHAARAGSRSHRGWVQLAQTPSGVGEREGHVVLPVQVHFHGSALYVAWSPES